MLWVVLLVLVAGALGVEYWRTHLGDLEPYGFGYRSAPVAPGTPVYIGIYEGSVDDDPHTVTIDRVTPRVTGRTSETRFEYLICYGPLGSVHGRAQLEQACDRIEPALGRQTTFGAGGRDARATLVVGIDSTAAGRVVIEGYDIDYSSGWRRGSRHSQVMTTVPFRRYAGSS